MLAILGSDKAVLFRERFFIVSHPRLSLLLLATLSYRYYLRRKSTRIRLLSDIIGDLGAS